MLKRFYLFLLPLTIIVAACEKDNTLVSSTNPVGNYVIIPPVAPPTEATDSTLLMGNPSNATTNVADFSNYLIKEGYYSVSYSRDLGRPNWCSWHLGSTDYGSVPRQDNFRANPALPDGWYRVDNLSYSNSGFDRGHLCPSQDRTTSIEANSSTFLMTNIVPQAPQCNQLPWANLESYCKQLVQAGNELYIIAGAHGEGGTGTSGDAMSIDNGRVSVPKNLWKVIVVLKDSSDDLRRVKSSTRVISVMMPNVNSLNTDWKSYRVSVDSIERATEYDLLSKLPTQTQTVIEARVDNQ